jgi:DNA-binding response OmpR family regulator
MEEYPTILLVEDNETDIILIKRAFRKSYIANPLQVVKTFQAAKDYILGKNEFSDRTIYPTPVMILLDLKLPDGSGLDFLKWKNEKANYKRIPVIVLTGSQNDEDINKAYDLGANSYIVKPVNFGRLIDMVKSLENYWFVLNKKPDV